MRATLSHVEAALESREAELHDSWQALRLQAADLQADAELTPEMLQPDASARVHPTQVVYNRTLCFCGVRTDLQSYLSGMWCSNCTQMLCTLLFTACIVTTWTLSAALHGRLLL